MNEIDQLMARIEEDPTLCTAKDIDDVIAYQRRARAKFDSGGPKPKRGQSQPAAKVDLVSLGLVAEAPKVNRRF